MRNFTARYTLRRPVEFYSPWLETSAELCDFVQRFTWKLSPEEECLALTTAVTCRKELWNNDVLLCVSKTEYPSRNLRTVLKQLAQPPGAPADKTELESLFRRNNDHLLETDIPGELIRTLHFRKSVEAPEIILPKLRWHSRKALWEGLIPTLRICAPEALTARRIRFASMRSSRCRLFLEIAQPETDEVLVPAALRALSLLPKAPQRVRSEVIGDIFTVCIYEGPRLATAVGRQLLRLGDCRNIETLVPFFSVADTAADIPVLQDIAQCSNKRAAERARAKLGLGA